MESTGVEHAPSVPVGIGKQTTNISLRPRGQRNLGPVLALEQGEGKTCLFMCLRQYFHLESILVTCQGRLRLVARKTKLFPSPKED